MTMPHLMNCGHDENGWCLACVKEQHDDLIKAVIMVRDMVAPQSCLCWLLTEFKDNLCQKCKAKPLVEKYL